MSRKVIQNKKKFKRLVKTKARPAWPAGGEKQW
jgi:hypothetical protein